MSEYFFHIRIRIRRPSGQSRGSNFRCHSGRYSSAGPACARRGRNTVNTGLVVLAGEITTSANVDYVQVARETIKRIGYDDTELRASTQRLRGACRL